MKQRNWPAHEESDAEGSAPRGHELERRSGVRPRPPPDLVPCASVMEAYARHKDWMQVAILGRLQGNWSATDDILQRVFIRLDRRVREQGSVPHPVEWVLRGLLKDEIRNHVRDQKRRCEGEPPDSGIPSSGPDPEQLLSGAESAHCVKGILAEMDETQVTLLELHHGRGLHVKDVAAFFGKAAGTIAVEIHRARTRFKELYTRHHGSRRKP